MIVLHALLGLRRGLVVAVVEGGLLVAAQADVVRSVGVARAVGGVRAVDVAPLRIEWLAQGHAHPCAAVIRVADRRQIPPVKRVVVIFRPGGGPIVIESRGKSVEQLARRVVR